MDSGASRTMEVAALGRPFSLGMLYDCRTDSLVPGPTLWDRSDLAERIGERPQNYNDFEIVASESIGDKSSALKVEASLKASFLGGLVEVDGSAKYLNDSKTSKNQARVTLKYKATTKVQELSMDHLGRGNVKHPDVFDKGLATHVVTAVLYGAQAFFVFDREVSEKEDHQDIEGNLKVMIQKIPCLAIEGEGSLKMEDKDREKVEKFSCRFYGDFSLQKMPTSFQDAIQVYQSLPTLLGANGENAVPMKVWMLPLTCLDSTAAKLVRQISLTLDKKSQSVLEDFSELEMRCNDALKTTTAQQFPQIGTKIKTFKEMCSEFKLEFQQTLAKKLPSIRGGGEEEAVLAEILKKRHSSPFNSKDLNNWMDCKEREIHTLKSFTNMMKNTKIISSETDLYKESLSADHAVCFVFTSLGSDEPYLSTLSECLEETTKPDEARRSRTHDVEKEQWYASREVADKMRSKAKLFSDFAEANKENKNIKFLAAGLIDETQKGSSIYLYKDGFSVTENFEPPSKPETLTVTDINHNSVTLKIYPAKFGTENITSYSVEYCVSGQDGWKEKTAAEAEEVTVSDLSPNTEYKFRCRAVTSVGVGPANELSGSIKTLPCSPPGEPQVEPNSSEISVSWEKSQQISHRFLEDFSELEMRCNDALKTTTAQQFPQIGTKIKTFKEMCSEFKLGFQQTFAKKLPSVRGGGEEEAVLAEILKKRHSSPFNSKDLNKWMDCKEREIHTLKSFTNIMKNTKIISSESDLYKESLSADHAVCFVFTSLGSDEPYLSTLSEYLEETTKPVEARRSRTHDVEKEQWYASREVADKMRSKAKLFSDFAEANKENKNIKFLAAGLIDETQKGSSIYLYEDGFSVTENFEPPSKPETLTVTDINHNSVTLKIYPAKFGAENITSYSVEYCVSGQDGWKEKTAAEAEEVTVSDLSPNTEYKFRCRAVTSVGVGPANEVSGSIKTLPCSPPGEPQVEPNSSEISASWEKSQQISHRFLEDFSELEMRCNDALKTTTAQQFPQIGTKIKTFKEMCSEFKLEFQQTFAKKLPSIRGGGEEEAVLAEILKKRHSSPFNSKDLNKWMDCKEREIDTLKSFTNMMKNTKIVSSETDLNKESLSADHAVCFVFTSLGSDEPYLSTLSEYSEETTKPVEARGSCSHDVEKEQWYASREVAVTMRSKAKLFSDFAEANKGNKNIKFLAVGSTRETHKGSSIYLYKDGFSVTENFEPPSKPETLTVRDINHNSVTLKISPAKFGAENITSYSVEYCVSGQDGWKEKTAAAAEEVTVSDLSPNTEYKFRCRAVTSVGVGPANELSGSIKTSPCSPPGKPQVEPNSCEISVSWDKPAELGQDVQILNYIVEYTKTESGVKEEDLQWNQEMSKTEKTIISGLQSETEYVVRVRCDCGEAGRSNKSISSVFVVKERLADAVKNKSSLLEHQSGRLPVYKVPLEEESLSVAGCRCFSFGKDFNKHNRTIMVLGATGAGKSTLINGMINYILGVEWEDPYRFKLVREDPSKSQTESQTSEVTVYKINHQQRFKIDHSLTIVDTPGFGDTRGIKRDKEITEQLRNLFTDEHGVSEIDAVCFVAQASLARLTPSQKYVFDSVLSIFGKDVAENIRVLVTFADGQLPPVLEAITVSGVPCPKTKDGLPLHFKFNNSALFADNKSSAAGSRREEDEDESDNESFDKMFWGMGTKSMKKFFDALNKIETKSLTLTKEVLRERQRLQNSVENLQEQVKVGLATLEEIKKINEKLKDHEAEISRNENFEFEVTVMTPVQIDISGSPKFISNCQTCHVTCHFPCYIPNDADKRKCCAMGSDGNCTECPGKCHWSVHFNQKYKWEYKEVTTKETKTTLKEKYLKAKGAMASDEELFDGMNSEYDRVQAEVVKLMERSANCLNRLKDIALKPNPLSTPDYIDLLIEGEKSEGRPGWQQRVQQLTAVREQAEYMAKVERREELLHSPPTGLRHVSKDKQRTTDKRRPKGDTECLIM